MCFALINTVTCETDVKTWGDTDAIELGRENIVMDKTDSKRLTYTFSFPKVRTTNYKSLYLLEKFDEFHP